MILNFLRLGGVVFLLVTLDVVAKLKDSIRAYVYADYETGKIWAFRHNLSLQ